MAAASDFHLEVVTSATSNRGLNVRFMCWGDYEEGFRSCGGVETEVTDAGF